MTNLPPLAEITRTKGATPFVWIDPTTIPRRPGPEPAAFERDLEPVELDALTTMADAVTAIHNWQSRQEFDSAVVQWAAAFGTMGPPPPAANDNDAFPTVDPSDWQDKPVPTRPWLVPGLVPSRNVTILSGDGGLGKSLLALQLGVATALGRETLGLRPTAGRVLYVGAEDEPGEFHRRLIDLLEPFGARLGDLRGQFRLSSLADRDAIMAAPDRSGQLAPTSNWYCLCKEALSFRPVLIVLDTAADLFGGDEIKRGQVRQFIGMLRSLAMEISCAIILLSHPSTTGLQTGSGTSGSTAWSNSVRSRLYLAAGDDADSRTLTSMKSNYGPAGDALKLRYQEGAFVLDDGSAAGIADKLLEPVDDALFLRLLFKFNRQGQSCSPNRSSTYAPTVMTRQPEAKGVPKVRLERAMQRLLDRGDVSVTMSGPASKQRATLWVTVDGYRAG